MTEPKKPTPEQLAHIINQGLRPHAPTLAGIGFSGDVVVAVFEPGEEAKKTALAIGWDGESPVFRMSPEARKTLAGSGAAETALGKWLQKKFVPAQPVARILVLTGDAPVMLNFSAFGGWALESEEAEQPKPSAADAKKPN